jgi:hypothetical protein
MQCPITIKLQKAEFYKFCGNTKLLQGKNKMLSLSIARNILIEIDKQLDSKLALKAWCAKTPAAFSLGSDVTAHITELKELRYQLAMTPERVLYALHSDDLF